MPIKVIFTIFTAIIAVAVLFVDPKANNAGPNWLWRGGENDFVRNLICRGDGTLKKYTKVSLIVWFMIILTIVWIIPVKQ